MMRILTGFERSQPPIPRRLLHRRCPDNRADNITRNAGAGFNTPEWTATLPVSSFDAVAAGFAVHYSEDECKRWLQQKFSTSFNRAACSSIANTLAAFPRWAKNCSSGACTANIVRIRRKKGQEANFENVPGEISSRLEKSANRLTPIETQLQWLLDIGYADADCCWKYYELAVFAGYKPEF